MNRLIIGCGYLGKRVASQWLGNGDQIHVLTRSRAGMFRESGYLPLVGDITDPGSLPDFSPVETVLFAVGFDRSKYDKIDDVYVDGLNNILKKLPDQTGHFIYISSTGVFGQDSGEWVNEDSATQPRRDGGKACLAAENLLRGSRFGDRTTVLRLAGIYGPGRVPSIRKTKPKIISNSYLNLIHVDDAASVIATVADLRPMGETFLVSDGQPVFRKDYYQEVGHYHDDSSNNIEQEWDSSEASGKRIRNVKMTSQLQIQLNYPSYKEGLAHIFGAGRPGNDIG